PTLVDDPVAVAADVGPADGVVGMERDPPGGRAGRGQVQPGDVGCAELLGDVVERLAVRGPHGRAVLTVERGQPAVVGAVAVAEPEVVVGRPAVALAVPRALTADVGDAVALPGNRPVLGVGDADRADGPAGGRHDVEGGRLRVSDGPGGREQYLGAV